MRKFEITVMTPYEGTDNTYIEYCDILDEAICLAKDLCTENAENFEHLIFGWHGNPTEIATEKNIPEEEINNWIDEQYAMYYEGCDWVVNEILEEEEDEYEE